MKALNRNMKYIYETDFVSVLQSKFFYSFWFGSFFARQKYTEPKWKMIQLISWGDDIYRSLFTPFISFLSRAIKVSFIKLIRTLYLKLNLEKWHECMNDIKGRLVWVGWLINSRHSNIQVLFCLYWMVFYPNFGNRRIIIKKETKNTIKRRICEIRNHSEISISGTLIWNPLEF